MQAFVTQTVFEQTGGVTLMGRGRSVGVDGPYFLQSQFSAIIRKVFDMADPTTPINGEDGEELTISAVIYNALQTSDDRWTKDGTGYNFLDVLDASHFPKGGRRYRVEYLCYPDGRDDFFPLVFEVPTVGLFSV